MPSYPLKALVLKKTRLGETDTIVTLLAEDGRQVRAVAKGARKPGSRFGGRMEPFTVLDLLLHTGRNLDVVSEARTVTSHPELVADLDRSSAAAVVADVLEKIALEGQAEPRLFGLACATLDALDSASPAESCSLVTGFLLKALAMHGYRPEFEACAVCGADVPQPTLFSIPRGGVVCDECGTEDVGSQRVDPATVGWLLHLLRSTMSEIAVEPMPDAARADCFAVVRSFVAFHLPARLKALDFYTRLSG